MNLDLTERQVKLIEAIIREYAESSEPVGSKTIVRKYSFKCSPATVRNEMGRLLEGGFLEMVHSSSGRVPTPRAYRLFIEDLMEEEEIPVLQEVAVKQRLWPQRFEFEKLLRQAVLALSDITKNLSVAISSDGFVIHAGSVYLLDHPEFWDIDATKSILHLLDRHEFLEDLFKRASFGSGDVKVLVGDEIDIPGMGNCAFVFAPFLAEKKQGHIAVIGPSRMEYQHVVPAVKYTKGLLEELGTVW